MKLRPALANLIYPELLDNLEEAVLKLVEVHAWASFHQKLSYIMTAKLMEMGVSGEEIQAMGDLAKQQAEMAWDMSALAHFGQAAADELEDVTPPE